MASPVVRGNTARMTIDPQSSRPSPTSTGGPEVMATHLYVAHWNEVDALIRQADLKAQVLLGIDALLLAALSRAEGAVGGFAPVDTFLEYLTLAILLASITMALSTIAPRIGKPPSDDALLYFRAVASMDPADFVDRYVNQTPQELLRRVAFELHAKSRIADRKLVRIRQGVLLLAAAATTWSLALVVGL